MDSGRRRRSSSRGSSRSGESSSSRSGESSGSRNGSSSSSRRRRSSSEGSSRRSSRSSSEPEPVTGKKKLFFALTLAGIAALGVAFYMVFDAGENPQGAPRPAPTPTPAPALADGSDAPEPPKNLGLTMEQYLDKLDSFGDHFQEQADFTKFATHAHVDWRCKVYSNDTNSPVKSVKLVSADSDADKYHVNAFFYKPDPAMIDRVRLLQRGDVVRLTGAINEDDIRVVDAADIVLTN